MLSRSAASRRTPDTIGVISARPALAIVPANLGAGDALGASSYARRILDERERPGSKFRVVLATAAISQPVLSELL